MAIRTKPTDTRITHHVSLIKDGVELGLLLSDGRGNLDPKAMRQGNNPRTSLQIRQGDADYSDFELPYTPQTQKEWSGGRGLEEFEADKSRYFDSKNLNAVHGRGFLGPKLNVSGFYNAAGAGTYIGGNGHFFDYKGAKYFVSQPDDGTSAPILSMNGWRGVAKAGSTTLAMVTSLNLTGITLAGYTIEITAGTGYTQERRWRRILSNTQGQGGGDSITVSEAWLTAAGTDTEFVIHGSNDWREVTGHGLTKPVTSVVVYGEHVYFAMGEDTFIRRVKWTNTGPGTWSITAVSEAGAASKATFLKLLPRTNGGMRIWKVNNPTIGVPTAAYATPVSTWIDLDFGTKPTELVDVTPDWPIPLVSVSSYSNSKVTSIEAYGDPITPWILKEDEIGNVSNGIYSPIPLTEMRSVKHDSNGKAALQYGVYLFFSLLDGLERYYSNRLDDIGPNRELGFPQGRKGKIVSMVPYPGQIYLSVDAGWTGYSSILSWNGMGFHELFRAELPNLRIREMSIQTTPDDQEPDRLYFIYGGFMRFLHVATNPLNQNGYKFTDYGYLQSARINGGFAEVNKFWHEFRIFLNRYSPEKLFAKASYRVTAGVAPRDIQSLFQAVPSYLWMLKNLPKKFANISLAGQTDYLAIICEGTNVANGGSTAAFSDDNGRTLLQDLQIDQAYFEVLGAANLGDGSALVAVGGGAIPANKTRIYRLTRIAPPLNVNKALRSSYFELTVPIRLQKIVASGNHVYALTATNVYYSADGGVNWVIQTTPALDYSDIEIIGNYVYAVGFSGLDGTHVHASYVGADLFTPWINVYDFNATSQTRILKLTDGDYALVGLFSAPAGPYIITRSLGEIVWTPVPHFEFQNVGPQSSIGLHSSALISDVIATAQGGILIALYQNPGIDDPIQGTTRGFFFYSHNKGKTWFPYTSSELISITGGLHRISGDCILFGASSKQKTDGRNAVMFRSDSDLDWVQVPTEINQAVTELPLSTDDSVSGQRLQYMIELYSTQEFETPVLKAVTIDAVTRLRGKKSWVLSFLIDDMAVDLQGKRITWTAQQFITQLETWADSSQTPTPIYMMAPHTIFNNKPVFIEYPVITPIEVVNTEQPHKIKLICQLTVTEA